MKFCCHSELFVMFSMICLKFCRFHSSRFTELAFIMRTARWTFQFGLGFVCYNLSVHCLWLVGYMTLGNVIFPKVSRETFRHQMCSFQCQALFRPITHAICKAQCSTIPPPVSHVNDVPHIKRRAISGFSIIIYSRHFYDRDNKFADFHYNLNRAKSQKKLQLIWTSTAFP